MTVTVGFLNIGKNEGEARDKGRMRKSNFNKRETVPGRPHQPLQEALERQHIKMNAGTTKHTSHHPPKMIGSPDHQKGLCFLFRNWAMSSSM